MSSRLHSEAGSKKKDPEKSSGKGQPEEFSVDFVRPTVEEYLKADRDMRLGVLAALVINYLVDNLLHGPKNFHPATDLLDEFRKDFEKRCIEVKYVRELSNKIKHVNISKILRLQPETNYLLNEDGGKISLEQGNGAILLESSKVVFAYHDQSEHNLGNVIRKAVDFLAKHLSSHSRTSNADVMFQVYFRGSPVS